MSAVSIADGSGRVRSLAVSNSWLEARGLVTSAEDLESCVKAASASGANGYPAALSALLGLDPFDPVSQVRFDGIGVSDETVELSLRAGDRPLPQDAPFVLQGKAELSDGWLDLDDVVYMPGIWTVPLSSNRFFRADSEQRGGRRRAHERAHRVAGRRDGARTVGLLDISNESLRIEGFAPAAAGSGWTLKVGLDAYDPRMLNSNLLQIAIGAAGSETIGGDYTSDGLEQAVRPTREHVEIDIRPPADKGTFFLKGFVR